MAVLDTAIFSRTKEDARVKRGQDELKSELGGNYPNLFSMKMLNGSSDG
jgi:hypothetical protein